MTKGNGLPCKKCGTSSWYKGGACIECRHRRAVEEYWADPEKAKSERRKYYRENREEILRKQKETYDPKKQREYMKRWYAKNKEIAYEKVKKWRAENPDKVAAIKHNRRARKAKNGGTYTAEEWQELVQEHGKCLACGASFDEVDPTVDHVIPVVKGGTSSIDNLQPLCRTCNNEKYTKIIDYRKQKGPHAKENMRPNGGESAQR